MYWAGCNLFIKCLSSNYTKWTHNGNIIDDETLINGDIYIEKMIAKYRGMYQCVGVNEYGVEFWAISMAYYISKW